jgi:hypothetical protein
MTSGEPFLTLLPQSVRDCKRNPYDWHFRKGGNDYDNEAIIKTPSSLQPLTIPRAGTNYAFYFAALAIVILNGAARSEESLNGGGGEMLRYTQHDKTALSARAKYISPTLIILLRRFICFADIGGHEIHSGVCSSWHSC